MQLLIKCASAEGAFALTVRGSHGLLHAESGFADAPGGEAVRRALLWLSEQPAGRGTALLLTQGPPQPLGCGEVLALLWHKGWEVDLQFVAPVWVAEAEALARRTLLGLGPPRLRPHRRRPCPPANKPASSPGANLLVVCDGGYRPHADQRTAVFGYLVFEGTRLLHQESGIVCRGSAAGAKWPNWAP